MAMAGFQPNRFEIHLVRHTSRPKDRQALAIAFVTAAFLLLWAGSRGMARKPLWETPGGPGPGSQGPSGWKLPPDAKKAKNPMAGDQASIAKGKAAYDKFCKACHGATGMGDGPIGITLNPKATDLTNRKGMALLSDGELFWMITVGKQPMPRLEKLIPKDDRWRIVSFLRTLAK